MLALSNHDHETVALVLVAASARAHTRFYGRPKGLRGRVVLVFLVGRLELGRQVALLRLVVAVVLHVLVVTGRGSVVPRQRVDHVFVRLGHVQLPNRSAPRIHTSNSRSPVPPLRSAAAPPSVVDVVMLIVPDAGAFALTRLNCPVVGNTDSRSFRWTTTTASEG